MRRDADELDGFLEFLAGEIAHPGCARRSARLRRGRRAASRAAVAARRRRTATTPTRAACSSTPSASRRSAARPRSCIRGCAAISCSRPRSLHDVGRTRELERGAGVPADRRGPAARPRPPRPAADRGAGARPSKPTSAPSSCTRSRCHHDLRAATHRRGGGALPREPARRGRGYSARRVQALACDAA